MLSNLFQEQQGKKNNLLVAKVIGADNNVLSHIRKKAPKTETTLLLHSSAQHFNARFLPYFVSGAPGAADASAAVT